MMTDFHVIRAAKKGDFGPLIDKLRSDAGLSSRLRKLVADMLECKREQPPQAPKRGHALKSRVFKWYREDWVSKDQWRELGSDHLSPSEQEDGQAARARFGKNVTRDMIREARRKFAPSDWKRAGTGKRKP